MKKAIVLEGGGSLGAWQVGVLWKIFTLGIKPDAIYGTSVGALNAAGIAYRGHEELVKIWKNIKGTSDIIKFNWLSLSWKSGLYSTEPLEKLLKSFIVGTPKIEAIACHCDATTGEIFYTSNKNGSVEDFRRAVLASASFPVFMETVGDLFDGGVREQTPLSKAIKDGADEIVVILTNPLKLPAFKSPSGAFKWVKYGIRTLEIILHESMMNDIQRCLDKNKDPDCRKVKITLYAPDRAWGRFALEFDPEMIANAITSGSMASPIVFE